MEQVHRSASAFLKLCSLKTETKVLLGKSWLDFTESLKNHSCRTSNTIALDLFHVWEELRIPHDFAATSQDSYISCHRFSLTRQYKTIHKFILCWICFFFYVSLLVFTGFDTGVMYHLLSVQTHLMFAQFFSVAYFK